MGETAFGKMCIEHGFAKLAPRYYARCYGDGILQTIYTGFKKYIDPVSPNYSVSNRKSNYICIGIRSMYSYHLEETFIPGKDDGGYRPADLIHMRKYTGGFNGIEDEYEIMAQYGFDSLDSINSQEAFLNCWSAIQTDASGGIIHDSQLVEPFLLCARQDDAEKEICTSFMHCMGSFYSYLDHVESGRFAPNLTYENEIHEKAKKKLHLWTCCIGHNYNELDSYIKENYNRNLSWLYKYGIPTYLPLQPRSLVDM